MLKAVISLITLVFLINISAHAELADRSTPTVNVLTWWNYLDSREIIEEIEDNCNVKISIDEYFSNIEFLRRWKNNTSLNYDIIVFSDTIYGTIQDGIKVPESNFSIKSTQYNEVIKKKYQEYDFPPNVLFFLHSLTGFLWNPEIIQLEREDSIFAIFKKAKNNIVVLINDPAEARKLISLSHFEEIYGKDRFEEYKNELIPLSIKNFEKLIQDASIYISNEYSKIYQKNNFAFSYTWSGDGLIAKIKDTNHKFLVHPKLSYVSTDLIAHLNMNSSTLCVANTLSSKKILNKLQNKYFYFSPYADSTGVDDPTFKEIYQQFITQLPELPWISTVSREEFDELDRTWEFIRLEMAH